MTTPFDALKAALADRYTLEREVGAGGMATVFLAHDPRHNRKVAIKIMHADLAGRIGPERFRGAPGTGRAALVLGRGHAIHPVPTRSTRR